jgi:hypothetical protein
MSMDDLELTPMMQERLDDMRNSSLKYDVKMMKQLHNKRTGANPAVLHFNGGSKHLQRPLEEQISSEHWFEKPDDIIRESSDIQSLISGVEFESICSNPRKNVA